MPPKILNAISIVLFGLILLMVPRLTYAQEDESYTVNVPNAQGSYTSLVIRRSGNGFVGPQGEYYSEFPTVSQLQVIYGLLNNNQVGVPQATAIATTTYPNPRVDFHVNYFYDSLVPYGQWIYNNEYGWVWSPYNMPIDWRPYIDGRWLYTDRGWMWVSDLPWGWACFHYGRWFYDDDYGWLWYPDTVWAPSWVVWRTGGDWIGWAPLPPRAIWRMDIGFGSFQARDIPWHHYSFCHFNEFTRPNIQNHIVASVHNVTIINQTNITINTIKVVNNHVVNRLPFHDTIVKAAGYPIAMLKVAASSSPGQHQIAGNEIRIFKPQINVKTRPPEINKTQMVAPLPVRHDPQIQEFNQIYTKRQSQLLQQYARQIKNPPRGLTEQQLIKQQKVEIMAQKEQMARERRLLLNRQERNLKQQKNFTVNPNYKNTGNPSSQNAAAKTLNSVQDKFQ